MRRAAIRYSRAISRGCAGFNQATVSSVSSGDVTPARVVRTELRAESHDLLTREAGGNAKHSQRTPEGEPLSSTLGRELAQDSAFPAATHYW